MNIIPPALNATTEMLVVFNDTQLKRNCDEEALGAAIAFLETYKDKITHFIFNGDILDFEEQSMYAHTPDMQGQTHDEIESGKWLIRYISELLPNAERVFIWGNHEARFYNFLKNNNMGLQDWLISPEDMFGLRTYNWRIIEYGRGRYYKWHDHRIFWHGSRAGLKSNIVKQELDDTGGISVTTAHINRNMYHEQVDAWGNHKSAIAHGGFSKNNLPYIKKAATSWSQGFGVYYWHNDIGEQAYSIVMKHGHPEFIWNGLKFSGRGFKIP